MVILYWYLTIFACYFAKNMSVNTGDIRMQSNPKKRPYAQWAHCIAVPMCMLTGSASICSYIRARYLPKVQSNVRSLNKILTCPSISTIISTTELNEVIIILWELFASHNKELNLSAKKFKQTINQIVNAVSINVEKKLINTYIHKIFINFFSCYALLCFWHPFSRMYICVRTCVYLC